MHRGIIQINGNSKGKNISVLKLNPDSERTPTSTQKKKEEDQ